MKISRNSAFLGSDKPRMLFVLLINVKMPTIVGILTYMYMSRKISFSAELSMNFFITSKPEALDLCFETMLSFCTSLP